MNLTPVEVILMSTTLIATHPSPELIDGYRNDDLAPPEARAVGNHLLWCVECRSLVQMTHSVSQLLKRLRDADWREGLGSPLALPCLPSGVDQSTPTPVQLRQKSVARRRAGRLKRICS